MKLIYLTLFLTFLVACTTTPRSSDGTAPDVTLYVTTPDGPYVFGVSRLTAREEGGISRLQNNCSGNTRPVFPENTIGFEGGFDDYPVTLELGVIDGYGVRETELTIVAGTFSRVTPADATVREDRSHSPPLRRINRVYPVLEAMTLRQLRVDDLFGVPREGTTIQIVGKGVDYNGNLQTISARVGPRNLVCR